MNDETMQCVLQLQTLLRNDIYNSKGTAISVLKTVLDYVVADPNQALIAPIWTDLDIAEAAGWGTQPMLVSDMLDVASYAQSHHDAIIGINWDVLSDIADELGVRHAP
ncbi:MAG: hypothetical protein BWK73_25385 [Thiothrix lacustris]|uniref:Uncharacterized protein n=1 Tax=Thiothrix lacustris TaxID=525917 RepID=A0A1Y1QL53_9GAMM|nr:MAG: hypothetical protein BWK73_25385 [Thiothrix lacustris]